MKLSKLLFLMLVASNLFSQQTNFTLISSDSITLIDSAITYLDSSYNEKHTYTYNSNGNMLSNFKKVWDGTQWINSGREIYEYDSSGNKTFYLIEGWEDSCGKVIAEKHTIMI